MDFDFENNSDDDIGQLDGGGAEGFFGQFEEAANPDFVQKQDAVLFVIDCQKHLFNKLAEEEFTQDQNPLKFTGINRAHALEVPSAERIKATPNIAKDFIKNFGFAAKETSLHEVLWLCNSEFQNLDKNKFNRRIFLFTCDDNPHSTEQQLRDQAIHHFRQLNDMDVSIELFPLESESGIKFDMRKFYVDVLALDLDEVNDAVLDTSQKIMEIQTRLRQREFKKRTLNRLLFELGNGTKLGVKIYCHINKAKKPTAKKLHKENNKPLKRTVKQLCTDTGKVLYNEHIGTYYPLKNEKIRITKEEINKIKAFDQPSMKLMGFKPASKLKLYHNYRTSYFLYPDEQRVKGSSQLVHALITQMLAKDKIAIVRFIPRAGTQVRFCALLPQEESYNENHFQTPPGFNLIYLPFADDIRTLKAKLPDGHTKLSKNMLDVAKLLVTSLDLVDFDPRSFEDPSLQKFYAHLQAHALGEENPEDPKDLLEPDEEGFERHAELIEMFQQYLDLEEPITTKAKPAKKEVTKKAPAGGTKAKIIIEKKEPKTKAGSKKAPAKKGAKAVKKEEEDSEDSRLGENDYDYKDGFVVDDRHIEEESDDDFKPKKKTKKTTKQNTSRSRQKKEETEDEDEGVTQNELEQIRANEIEQKIMEYELSKLTMDDVKFYLRKNNLNDKGRKKEDLVGRALNHISEKNAK